MSSKGPQRPLRSKSNITTPARSESKTVPYTPKCTTDEYVKAIAHHFRQPSSETLYPGEIYDTLKRFLEQKSNTVPNTASHGSNDFAWLISPSQLDQQASLDKHSLSDSNRNREQSEGFADPQSCIEALRARIELSHPQVLFLRVHPSPSWLSSIGTFCCVDPELFRWFLRYCAGPGILYHRIQVYRCHSSQKEVDALRGRAVKDLQRYQAELRGNWALKPGDSIVRNFHVLDERHCVIEQEIVVSIFNVGKTWMAIACTDAGYDITQGPRFPWLEGDVESLPLTLLPIIQYRPRCPLKYRCINGNSRPKKGKNTQSLAIFPEGYGRGLDWSLAKSDRSHVLADMFRLSAFSQKQLLNVMEEKIRSETNRLSLSRNLLRGPNASILTPSEPASSTNLGSWTKDATAGSDKINPELISALKDFTIEHRDPILPCKSILLPRDPVFSGREDTLASIRQTLLADVQEAENASDSSLGEIIPSLNVYSLCGPGGMGKTSIANEFVHRYEKEFDAVFWIAADEESKLFNGFRDIALKLGIIPNTDGKDLPAIREALLAWLANPLRSYEHVDHVKPERASWLIVFDNVDRADTLEDFWPKDAAGSVLVTCRDPLIKSSIYLRNTGSVVPELLEEEGITLLLRLTNRESDEDDVKQAPRVVQALGRYPLAIVQMSGVILARDLGFNKFLELYSEEAERREILGISEGQSASLRRYNQTLGTVWNLDDLKEGRALLEVISFLDPDSIPESLLEKNPACMDWDRYPKTSLEYSSARAELLSKSLIYRNRGKKTLRVHRLIQDTVRTQMDDATFNEVYSRVLDMLGAWWPRVFKGFGNVQTDWQQNSELWPHALSLIKYRDRFDPAAADLATAIKRMDFALDALIFSVSDSRFSASPTILSFFGFLRDAVTEENPSYKLQMIDAIFHYCRGELGLHINHREHPLPDFSQCVKQLDILLDDDAKKADPLFGVAVNELGCAYLMNWHNEEGLAEFERAVTILQNLSHPSAQEITMAQINVGFVYGYLGRYDEALQIFDVALKDRYKKLGRDYYSSFVNGKLYLGWGNVLAAQGRLDDSFKLHVKCLEHYKRSVGNSHHRTGDGCVKASDHFARTGDGPTALALLDQALKIFNLDTYHRPEAARAHYKKGNVMKQMDQDEEASKEMDTALDIFNSFVPPEDCVGSIDELDDEDFDHWIMFWSR